MNRRDLLQRRPGRYSDHGIGQVMARLEELKLADNTMGRHRFMSKDFAFYEPAVRIPMIFHAAGRKADVVQTDPVSGIDDFPTLCELVRFAN